MSADPVEYELGDAFRGSFADLWEKELFSDLTVFLAETDGEGGHTVGDSLRCHRIVLGAWSPVLKEKALEAQRQGHPGWFSLKDMESASVRTLISAFYKEKLELDVTNVWGVRTVAMALQVLPAMKMCDDFITSRLSAKRAITWAVEARKAGEKTIEDQCLDVICTSFNVCRSDPNLGKLTPDQFSRVLDSPSLLVTSEYNVLVAVLSWANYDAENRMDVLPELLKKVRYKLMTLEEQINAKAGKHGFSCFQDLVQEAVLKGERAPGMDPPRGKVIISGIQHDMPIESVIKGGWKLELVQPYKQHTSYKDIKNIRGKYLLVAASKKHEKTIALCAMGRRDSVLKVTEKNKTTYDNGVYWYCNPERAFGFSPVPVVDLGAADQLDLQGDKRLSWHLHQERGTQGDAGGFRAGMRKDLIDSEEWKKLIFSLDS